MPHPPRREPSPIQIGPNKRRAPKTTSNLVTAWWDASQIYGHDELSRKRVRWDPHDPARLLVIEGDLPFLQKCESCYDCLGHPDGSVVDNIEDVDNIVGWLAEYTRPHGFALSETQFHIFIINASRRLFSDRFFTSSFRPGFYSRLGYDWVIHNGPLSESPYPLTSLADGTEANNLAVRGVAHALRDKGRHLITSAVEHPAVLQPCKRLAADGWKISIIPVDRYGQVNPEDIVNAIRSDTVLVSVMHANNEVGTIQPIEEIAAATQRHGIRLHTDVAQSIGKIPVNVGLLGVDLLSLAGHKFYATKGVGALYV